MSTSVAVAFVKPRVLKAVTNKAGKSVMKRLVNLIREEDNLIKLTEAKSIKTVKEILFNEAIEEEK